MKNTFVKVLSFVMALMMVVGTFGTLAVFAADCTHDDAIKGEPVPAKCDTMGYTWYSCPDCGLSYKDDYVQPSGEHKYASAYADGKGENATCTDYGYTAGEKCTVCGAWNPEKESKPNGDKKPIGHKFEFGTLVEGKYCNEVTAIVYYCTGCGKSAQDCKTADKDGDFAPEAGYDAYIKAPIKDAEEHKWVKGDVITAPATECDPAVVVMECEKCGLTKTVNTGSRHDYKTVDLKGDYKNYCGPYLKYDRCSKCGDTKNYVDNPGKGTDHRTTAVTTIPTNDIEFNKFNAAHQNAFTTAASLAKAPSCTESGHQVYKCLDCKLYFDKPLEKTAHEMLASKYNYKTNADDSYFDVLKAEHKGGVNQNSKNGWCVSEKSLVKICKNYATCGHIEVIAKIADGVRHDFDTKDNKHVTPATCTENGYTTWKCKTAGCALNTTPVKDTYTPATGHTLGNAFYATLSGNTYTEVKAENIVCTMTLYNIKKCETKGCAYFEKVSETPVQTAAAEHVNSEAASSVKEIEATCSEYSYKVYTCANSPLCTLTSEKIEGSEGTVLKADKHVGNVVRLKTLTAATCTAGGVDLYNCLDCEQDFEKVTEKLGHADKAVKFEKDGKVVKDLSAKPANCLETGLTEGKLCSRCGETLDPQTVVPVDSKTHKAAGVKLGDAVPATCQKGAYQLWRYASCCNAVVEQSLSDKLENCAENDLKVFKYQASTCAAAGNYTYTICSVCKTVSNVDIKGDIEEYGLEETDELKVLATYAKYTLADVTIEKLAHDWKDVEAKAAQCVKNGDAWTSEEGYTAHKECKICHTKNDDYRILRTHERNEKPFAAVAPECGKDGIKAGNYCTICITIEGSDDYKAAKANKLEHNYVEFSRSNMNKNGGVIDCTEPAFIMESCSRCQDVRMKDGSYIAAKDHDFEFVPETHTAHTDDTTVKADDVDYACWAASYTIRNCVNCEQTTGKVIVSEQIKHYYYNTNGVKVEIDTACNKIDAFDGFECALCGLSVIASEMAAESFDEAEFIGADHKYVVDDNDFIAYDKAEKKWVATSCTEWGHVSCYCQICLDEQYVETVPPLNPSVTPYDENKQINADVVEAILKIQESTATEQGYVEYVCKKCGLTHVYKLPLVESFEISGALSAETISAGSEVTYTVKFSGAAKEFGTLTLDVAYNAAKFDVKAVDTTLAGANAYYNVNANGLGITLVVPFDVATGEEQKVATTVAGTDVVTITFVAKQYVSGEAKFAVDACSIVKTVDCKEAKLAVVGLGNVNGKDAITAEDAAAVSKYFAEDAKYDASVDFNNDGIIDIDDLALIATFVASGKTAKDYLVMLGTYSEIKTIIDALYENNELLDLDGNGIINNNDRYILTNAVDAKLATYKSYTDINFASVEELVAGVMDTLVTSKA